MTDQSSQGDQNVPSGGADPGAHTAGDQATSNGELQKLQADFDLANKQIQELTQAAKHALADLQNYRRRVEQERTQFTEFATSALLFELLTIADNFERAFDHVSDEIKTTEWFKGVVQIEQQLTGLLQKQGVKAMPSTVGQKLDPLLHEAVTVGTGAQDVIIEEFEKGYTLGTKILRPAKVKVGNGVDSP